MTLYVANGVFCTFESGTGSDQLVVANGSFALFLSGTGGGDIIYSGSVGRFSVSFDLKKPVANLLPVIAVNAGRFSCSPRVKLSGAVTFFKICWPIKLSLGTSTADLIKHGLGYYDVIKSILQVGTFVSAGQSLRKTLSRGDCIQVAQMLEAALPDGFKKNIKMLKDLTESLRKLQKQQVGLSADEVAVVQNLLQSLTIDNDIRVARKLTISVSNPESRFESVSIGIYIDGRPI